jgi:hypothetical protein
LQKSSHGEKRIRLDRKFRWNTMSEAQRMGLSQRE